LNHLHVNAFYVFTNSNRFQVAAAEMS